MGLAGFSLTSVFLRHGEALFVDTARGPLSHLFVDRSDARQVGSECVCANGI